MAEVKYFGEFRSLHGHFYLIEIWDEDYTGSDPIQFNVTGNGFELNYSGQTDNIYSPIIGSSAYVQPMYNGRFSIRHIVRRTFPRPVSRKYDST